MTRLVWLALLLSLHMFFRGGKPHAVRLPPPAPPIEEASR